MDAPLLLDLVIGLVFLLRLLSGLRTGLLVGLFSLVGVVAGAAGGFWAGPRLVVLWPELDASRILRSASLIIVVMVGMGMGEALLGGIARRMRGKSRAKDADAFLGGVAAVLAVAAVTWFLLTAVRPFSPIPLARAIDNSLVYQTLDKLIPDQVRDLPGKAVDTLITELPKVFGGDEPQLPVPEPDADALDNALVLKASASVVQVRTDAPTCRSDSAGSGWVVSPQRVVTNAHVVAGASDIAVSVGALGWLRDAEVVAFDPDLDLAILAVPGLDAPALPRAPENQPVGADVVAAGYPWAGPYTLSQGRVRGTVVENGADIYGEPGVPREVYAIRGDVNPGNSGGPLLTPDGRVAGTVFAKSAIDPQTGYVLTDAATAPWLDAAAGLSEPVGNGGCLVG